MDKSPTEATMPHEQLAQWKNVGFTKLVSRRELEVCVDPKIVLDQSLDQLVITLKAYVLTAATGEPQTIRRTKTVTSTHYCTWWDHFKYTYISRWWMPFKKVRFKRLSHEVEFEVTIEPRAMFPHAKVAFPSNFGKPVIYYETRIDGLA